MQYFKVFCFISQRSHENSTVTVRFLIALERSQIMVGVLTAETIETKCTHSSSPNRHTHGRNKKRETGLGGAHGDRMVSTDVASLSHGFPESFLSFAFKTFVYGTVRELHTNAYVHTSHNCRSAPGFGLVDNFNFDFKPATTRQEEAQRRTRCTHAPSSCVAVFF